MDNLIIPGSEKTPFFSLLKNGELAFGGVSMPEDAAHFYFPIIDWITDYYREPCENTKVIVSFRYLNSSSTSMIRKIFYGLNRLQKTGKTNISCDWYYEATDEDMLDYISNIQELAESLDIKIHAKDNILDF